MNMKSPEFMTNLRCDDQDFPYPIRKNREIRKGPLFTVFVVAAMSMDACFGIVTCRVIQPVAMTPLTVD